MSDKIKLGISACLLGKNVRYDGGNKLDRFLRDILAQNMEYVPVCPEVDCGLSTPRGALQLFGNPENPGLVTIQSGKDYTEQMHAWGRHRLKELEKEGLSGFIFKSKSPSCGMKEIEIYNDRGIAEKNGVGIWARMAMDYFPLMPVEEESRLHDPMLWENFIERVIAFKRQRSL